MLSTRRRGLRTLGVFEEMKCRIKKICARAVLQTNSESLRYIGVACVLATICALVTVFMAFGPRSEKSTGLDSRSDKAVSLPHSQSIVSPAPFNLPGPGQPPQIPGWDEKPAPNTKSQYEYQAISIVGKFGEPPRPVGRATKDK